MARKTNAKPIEPVIIRGEPTRQQISDLTKLGITTYPTNPVYQLPERLRSHANHIKGCTYATICFEAADALEKLIGEKTSLVNELTIARTKLQHIRDEVSGV